MFICRNARGNGRRQVCQRRPRIKILTVADLPANSTVNKLFNRLAAVRITLRDTGAAVTLATAIVCGVVLVY